MRTRLWPEWPDDHAAEIDRFLRTPPEDEAVFVFVSVSAADEPTGFVEVSIRNRADGCDGSRIGYVEGWYVDDGARRRGAGAALVEAGEAWARDRGCREMASDCELGNDVSLTAHLALGYEETGRAIHFRKSLEGG